MKWINNLASIDPLKSASPLSCLQDVHIHGLKFHSPMKCEIIYPNVRVRSGVRTKGGLKGGVTNEAPGLVKYNTFIQLSFLWIFC